MDEALINEVNLRCISQKSTRYRAGKLALALFTAALFAGPTVAQITNPPAIKPLRAVDPGPRPVGNQSIVVKGAILNTGIVDTAQPMDADRNGAGHQLANLTPDQTAFWFATLAVFGEQATVGRTKDLLEAIAAANPFGICFSSQDGADSILPFPSWAYRPGYLSDERYILFADNLPLSEPEVFVLSWPQVQSSPKSEPMRHPLGLCEMRSVSVGLPDPTSISSSLRAIRDARLVNVHHSATPELVIEFTSQKEVQHSIHSLGLSLVGRQAPPH